ncbi:hypothetical protein [Methanorbis furvi]|uniref:hypothetical protein n=1 Tax=Methanorbis furvi TaxID=3028299 RepID=UPI0030B8DDDB
MLYSIMWFISCAGEVGLVDDVFCFWFLWNILGGDMGCCGKDLVRFFSEKSKWVSGELA